MKRLAIVTTHPIQYNAPLFKLIQERGNIQIKVFYTWGKTALKNKFDPGFGKYISWDIPLLDGYEYSFEKNISMTVVKNSLLKKALERATDSRLTELIPAMYGM